ncbi:hypothetical protein HF086_012393 [Spodoptera exigua]|uniref:Trafficking protein particle complex subunit 10 n=1 Tax=Spodoptera exigua TaxID=7107 RepID=A0A922M9P1_SPOEX|nr:hypothetical protein HF086_012393 [Spodoptera exigua]
MREQREKRNDPDWDFCKYFILQEQLAFVLEMLGLYDEALVQYDELDALFSQFVLNSNLTESPKWLDTFRQPVTSWQAVRLTALVPQHLRELVIKKKASCWISEAICFNVKVPCYYLHRNLGRLWICKHLHELGKLCGLLPGSPDPTSEQLHLVVMLSAGMGDNENNNQQPTPTDRLKEALCSKTSFQQYYLELAELAMGTYKHIGRLRFARLIGRDLAAFYSELGETGKAVVFLMDALRSYEEQGWRDLAAQTRLELVAAAKKMNDMDRYTKLSATIASTAELEILVRNFYFEEMMKCIRDELSKKSETNTTILLKTSSGLLIRFADDDTAMSRELNIKVPALEPFQTSKVWLTCPWREAVTEVPLDFTPPMVASWRLLTSNTRKFIHITLKSTVVHLVQFALTDPKLECDGNNDMVADLNPKNSDHMMIASDGTTASFMWELLKDPLVKGGPMKATFSVNYRPSDVEGPGRPFTCPFDIQDYTTLFVIRTKLEPSKGSDFCRASQMCCLQLSVQRVRVLTMECTSTEPQNVTLDVMPLVAGYLPLPTVRLSKYIAANTKDPKKDISAHPRLEPFSPGQVYHAGKAKQVHVLPPMPKEHLDVIAN